MILRLCPYLRQRLRGQLPGREITASGSRSIIQALPTCGQSDFHLGILPKASTLDAVVSKTPTHLGCQPSIPLTKPWGGAQSGKTCPALVPGLWSSVFPGASASPENLLEMQILGPHPRPTESQTPAVWKQALWLFLVPAQVWEPRILGKLCQL